MQSALPETRQKHKYKTVKKLFPILVFLLLTACKPAPQTQTPTLTIPTSIPSPTPKPQLSVSPNVNPLTGLPVADLSLLRTPALLVSISNFPAIGRPQAGLSFAPFVYEYYITEGATRFLAVFYGELPKPEIYSTGGCEVRSGLFDKTQTLIGRRVWLDSNANGRLDAGEEGVPGVCVNLYDDNGNRIQQTTTDTNGYYGFNVQPGKYTVEFVKPNGMGFTQKESVDAGDSAADPATGRVDVDLSTDNLTVNAGLVPAETPSPSPDAQSNMPLAQVGPIRSGRLIYGYIGKYFKNSCLIYAFASPEEQSRIPHCYMVFHQLAGGGYMLDISDLTKVALTNKKEKGSNFDYTSNLYADQTQAVGIQANKLNVYFAYQNQSGWFYDPLYQAYLHYVDTSVYDQAGVLHADVDRLTGRQLHFENVIVLFAKHEVLSPTNLDIHLDEGKTGQALLFRDGQMYKINWSTVPNADEQETGMRHPIQFLTLEGNPAPLKPGHTWIIVVTPDSVLTEKSPGAWTLTFSQPSGAK
jgi:hypothetical protein